MIENLTTYWDQLVAGELVTEEDLWWALLVCMLFAALHLVTMLVTRWGDHQATSKSLIFSVLVHLSCGMGLVAMNPPEPVEKQVEQEEPPEKEDPFQFREIQLAATESFETDQAGNTPFHRKISKAVEVAMTRRETLPLAIEELTSPDRKTTPNETPRVADPKLPPRPDEPMATPQPMNSGLPGPIQIAKIPDRIIDPTIERSTRVNIPSPKVKRIPRQRVPQKDIPITREKSRGKPDRVDNVLDVTPKAALTETVADPTAFLRRGREAALPRPRRAPVSSIVESDNTGAAARRKTDATGGGSRRPIELPRIPTSPVGGVVGGGSERLRPELSPRTPNPNRNRPLAVGIGRVRTTDPDGPRPNINRGGSRIGPKRRTNQLPATYRLRSLAKRKTSAEKYGGTDASERAVERALRWLARHQHPDGHWDAEEHGAGKVRLDERGTDRDSAGKDSDTGVTALALLSFLGAGYTHEEGIYARTVDKALRYLISKQRADGFLGGNARHYARMYCHGMAAYAMAEAYAMQSDPTVDTRLREPLRKAVKYILDTQSTRDGGWRYLKGQVSDVSMFGWQLMALKSAETAGLVVPKKAKQAMIQFLLDHSSGKNKGLASYQKRYKVSETMTAEALFCKQIFRIDRNHPASKEAADYLLARKPRRSKLNLYYWYYGTLAMFQYGGAEWTEWNNAVRTALVAEQSTSGVNDGSWDPKGPWGPYGGRVYSTALSALCLEVYYRFLPLYKMSGQQTSQ